MTAETIVHGVINTAVVTKATCIGACLFGPLGGLVFGLAASVVMRGGSNLHDSQNCSGM